MTDVTNTIARANAALRGGDFAGAERALAPALASSAPSADALMLGAEIRRLQGRLAEAEGFARRAAEADRRSGQAPGRLGAILQVQHRYEEARAAYEEALRREPELDSVRLNFVRCLFAMSAWEDAAAEANVLIARRPSVAAYVLLSGALCALRRGDEAIAAADRAIELAPSDRAARLAHARALDEAHRSADALSAYRALTHDGFANIDEVLGRARAACACDNLGEAERTLRDGLSRWPGSEPLLAALCRISWTQGAGEAFAQPILDALMAAPDDLNLRLGAANLLFRAHQHGGAEDVLREGLARRPTDAALLSSLAVVLDSSGRAEEALALYDAARAVAPKDDRIRANRVAALLRVGRADEALAELKSLREKRPDAQDLIAREALALRLKGSAAYRRLYDYDRYVRPYVIDPPPGFASLADFNRDLRARLLRLHSRSEHPLDQSLRNGTQTTQDLARSADTVVRAFIAALDAPIRDYIHKLPNDPADPMGRRKGNGYRIWGCWSVRLRPGGFHVNHVHPEGWISSSYYVEAPTPRAGDDPHAGWIKFGEPDLPTPGCGPELFIEPVPGKLVLFPSYMWHGTVPFGHGERLTAPFDVVPT